MKRISYLAIILLLIIILTACSINTVSNEDNLKLEDLEYFHDYLEKKHKNLYANISKSEFEIEKQKVAEKTSEMSDSDFYYSLKHLLSMVEDSHTTLEFSDSKFEHLNGLGFAVARYSDGWYLVMLEKENEQYLGYELLSINDVDIEEIFNSAKKIISYENETWAERSFTNTINFREALEYLGIVGESDPIVLKIEDNKGNNSLLKIESMNENRAMNTEILTITPKHISKTYFWEFYNAIPLDESTFFIQYNSCQESPDLSMKRFVENISHEIKENGYKKIIIDLRYNSGGNSSVFGPMIKELVKLKKEYSFNVYTIIGKNTFSSAIINAVQIKKELGSTLVGSPTGSNVNHYGEVKNFNLKNMPITIRYSTKYFELIKGYEKDSLYPDIYVEQNFVNYLNGVDSEVDMILEIED